MKKKKSGMTLVEVLMTLAVLAIAISAIYMLFNSSHRTLIDTEVKSQLQYEAQVIQERVATIGVESAGITELINVSTGTPTDEINKISFKSVSKEITGGTEHIEYSFSLDGNGVITLNERNVQIISGTTTYGTVKTKELSKNVQFLKVSLINTTDFNKAKSIKLEIKLKGKKGITEKDLTTSTIITFRNYGL